MKHTQSWLRGALSTGEGWVKNAGSFMNKHRYLIGGAIGGAALGMSGLAAVMSGERPPETFDRAPLFEPPRHHAIATGAPAGSPPVLLGNMRPLAPRSEDTPFRVD